MNGIRLHIANEVENCSIQVSHNTGSILDSSKVTSLSDQCLASKGTINHGECNVTAF